MKISKAINFPSGRKIHKKYLSISESELPGKYEKTSCIIDVILFLKTVQFTV